MLPPVTVDLVSAVGKIKEFFASQGPMAKLLTDVFFYVSEVEYQKEGDDWFLVLKVKMPELTDKGWVFTVKEVWYDIRDGRVKVGDSSDVGEA